MPIYVQFFITYKCFPQTPPTPGESGVKSTIKSYKMKIKKSDQTEFGEKIFFLNVTGLDDIMLSMFT